MKYRRKPDHTDEIEVVTFEELVAYGIANGAACHNGMPWSFQYFGKPITHENDDCYLILTSSGTMRMTRLDVLLSNVLGQLWVCEAAVILARYELVIDQEPTE